MCHSHSHRPILLGTCFNKASPLPQYVKLKTKLTRTLPFVAKVSTHHRNHRASQYKGVKKEQNKTKQNKKTLQYACPTASSNWLLKKKIVGTNIQSCVQKQCIYSDNKVYL